MFFAVLPAHAEEITVGFVYGKEPPTVDPIYRFEREVLKAAWKYIAHHPKVAWVTRINSGGLMADFGTAGMVPMKFNYILGMSDLIVQMKDGRFLAVECKREGVNLEDHQRDFLNEVRQAGGVAFVARNLDDCIRGLQ